jgi:FMN phosphatase YigB (HAD superfamily)
MSAQPPVPAADHVARVFLVDMDNTLSDNDAIKRDLQYAVVDLLGRSHGNRFWAIYEALREDHDFVDFPGTLERFHLEHPHEHRLHEISEMLWNLPFDKYLYPGALDTLAALGELGTVVILTDGDAWYQPRKLARSGVTATVDGRVLIYKHKERMLPEIEQRYPADHYVLVDDKPSILAAAKRVLRAELTTVLVRQGQYALSAALPDFHPAPDLVAETIADVGRNARAWFGG